MATIAKNNVSYRLLERLSDLVICSRCLRGGKVTPVPQIISGRRPLTNQCAQCRAEQVKGTAARRGLATLLRLPDRG